MKRGLQHNFSEMHPDAMYDTDKKEKKANTLILVLKDYFGSRDMRNLSVLDIGASTGIIDNYLAQQFGSITGIDIDEKAIEYASRTYNKSNLIFKVGDAMALDFTDKTFDVIICSHIYEHVPDAEKMLNEIARVLKIGGICYFSAQNRLSIREPHYNLPFLSVIPRPLGHLYLRLTGKGKYYYEKHLSYWGLDKLVRKFEKIDFTKRIISDPTRYGVSYMIKPHSAKHKIAKFVVSNIYWFCPGYIWLLKRREDM